MGPASRRSSAIVRNPKEPFVVMMTTCSVARRARAAVVAAAVLATAACSSSGGGAAKGALPAIPITGKAASSATLQSAVKHVIVVVLENRSFDNLFADDPALANTRNGPVNVDGGKTARTPAGVQPLVSDSLSTSGADAGHSHQDFLRQFDGGKNDGWYDGKTTGNNIEIGFVPGTEVQPYYDIASEFAISDNFFHGVTAPTWPSHVEIGAATTYGIIDNPSDNTWGCDAAPGTTTGLFSASAPGEELPKAGPFPCLDELSIFDLLDRGVPAPVSWKYYVAPEGNDITGNLNIAADFRHIRFGPDWNTDIAPSDATFLTDLSGGALPQVSFVIPNDASTDHAGTPSLGPTYIENLVDQFGASPYFANSVMLITWDDWGGWYDHVTPPKRADGSQLSFRKPILFVGGLVKSNYVSHVQTEDASIAKTIEEIFGLGTLGTHDVTANGFEDVIDPTQTPLTFKPITSLQGAAVTTPVGVIKLGASRAGTARFRVIPGNFLKYEGSDTFAARNDYYGARSADY